MSQWEPRDLRFGGFAIKLSVFREMVEKGMSESAQNAKVGISARDERERELVRRGLNEGADGRVDSVPHDDVPKDAEKKKEERDWWGSKFQRASGKFLRGKREGD